MTTTPHLIPWTIEVRALSTRLRVDTDPHRRQPATIDITARALAPAFPQAITDCIDYQPICEHVLGAWSNEMRAQHPELAARALVAFVLGHDERISQVDVALSTGDATVMQSQARPCGSDAGALGRNASCGALAPL